MAHIRHIAIASNDTVGLAAFYQAAFGLGEVARVEADAGTSVFLTDGYLHVAVLPTMPGRPEGMFHFGLATDDVAGVLSAALAAGATPPKETKDRTVRSPGAEADAYITDPAGIRVDIARGWWIGQTPANAP
jgi:catechol 2,3-dioxygenase-like lactoylglutathione lyase family enzyme